MVRTTDEWALLKDRFVGSSKDEPEESIEALLDNQIRRRFGEYITKAVCRNINVEWIRER
jgi:hypothetical protein